MLEWPKDDVYMNLLRPRTRIETEFTAQLSEQVSVLEAVCKILASMKPGEAEDVTLGKILTSLKEAKEMYS